MKKVAIVIVLCMLLPGCTSANMSQSTSTQAASSFQFGNIRAMVYTEPGIEVNNFHTVEHLHNINFDYTVGSLSGQASLSPSFNWNRNLLHETSISGMTLSFKYENGQALLLVNWTAESAQVTDTFALDETANIWFYYKDGSDLFAVHLTESEASRLFPDKELHAFSRITFLCYEPLKDVSFYRVSDLPGIYGPDVLLAHYDEYSSHDLFLWQTDAMYSWHLTIEYTTPDNKTHWVSYGLNRGTSFDATYLHVLDAPDWDTREFTQRLGFQTDDPILQQGLSFCWDDGSLPELEAALRGKEYAESSGCRLYNFDGFQLSVMPYTKKDGTTTYVGYNMLTGSEHKMDCGFYVGMAAEEAAVILQRYEYPYQEIDLLAANEDTLANLLQWNHFPKDVFKSYSSCIIFEYCAEDEALSRSLILYAGEQGTVQTIVSIFNELP